MVGTAIPARTPEREVRSVCGGACPARLIDRVWEETCGLSKASSVWRAQAFGKNLLNGLSYVTS